MIVALYTRLLQLYPKPFYDLLAEEMTDVFSLRLRDAHQHGDKMLFCLKEFGDLPLSILREQVVALRRYQPTQLERWRNFTRFSCLIFLMLYLLAGQPLAHQTSSYVIFVALNLIPILGLLLAFLWERMGAILALIGTIILAVWIFIGAMDTLDNVVLALLSATLFCLPYMLHGVAFIYLSFRSKTQSKVKFST